MNNIFRKPDAEAEAEAAMDCFNVYSDNFDISCAPASVRNGYEKAKEQWRIALSVIRSICQIPLPEVDYHEHIYCEPNPAYEDDGNTPTPGTKFCVLWMAPILRPISELEYYNWSRGETTSALYYFYYEHLRNRDWELVSNGASFYACDIPLDTEKIKGGFHRVAYSLHGVLTIEAQHLHQAAIYVNNIKAFHVLRTQIQEELSQRLTPADPT